MWSNELALSSKIQLLRSLQIVHIKHKGTKIPDTQQVFPKPIPPPDNRSNTLLAITHCVPKDRKTKLHNSKATLKYSKRWSTVSPSQWHIQHHPAIAYPLRIKLSKMRILPQATVQTKNETLWGALTAQTLLQGNHTPFSPFKEKYKDQESHTPFSQSFHPSPSGPTLEGIWELSNWKNNVTM